MPIEEIKIPKKDIETLEGLVPDIDALERELAKAERAGIDVSEQRKRFDEAKTLREGVLREYGE